MFLLKPWPKYWSGFDLITNYIAYLPLGFLAALKLIKHHSIDRSIVVTTLIGFCLSFAVEVAQNYLPQRVPSWPDLLLNTLGTLTGASVAMAQSVNIEKLLPLQELSRQWVKPSGRWAAVALLVWIAMQGLAAPLLFMSGSLPLSWITDIFQWWGLESGEAVELAASIPFARLGSAYASILVEVTVIAINLFLVTTLVIEFTTQKAARLPIGITIIGGALAIKSFFAVFLGGADPLHWLTIGAQAGLLVGALAALIAAGLHRQIRLLLCVVACFVLIVLANIVPLNPFQTAALASWRDGNWLTINGSLRHASMAWPWVMAVICLAVFSRARST